jgi:hypothetical protein
MLSRWRQEDYVPAGRRLMLRNVARPSRRVGARLGAIRFSSIREGHAGEIQLSALSRYQIGDRRWRAARHRPAEVPVPVFR